MAMSSEPSFIVPPSGKTEATSALPPLRPAVLVSEDGQTRFSILLLRWETALLPCTRYDEWLVCHLSLTTLHDECAVEGPFLLRFEVEEIFNAAQKAALGNFSSFQSDFLEPVLTFQFQKEAVTGTLHAQITLTPPEAPENTAKREQISVQMQVSPATLQALCTPLAEQLESFLSLL